MYSDFDIQRLRQILRFDSVQAPPEEGKPFGKGVYDCLLYALDIMKESGFVTKNIDGYCGYGEVGQGELFGILCHLDVVPVGKGWHYPPFDGTIDNNRVYGRGALDDKGPFIAVLVALERLLKESAPKKRIRIILGCNEESGWGCMERYKKTEELPVSGFSPDADFPVIYCEKGILHYTLTYPKPEDILSFKAGERPNMVPDEAKIIFSDGKEICEKGISAHGSTPEKGKNALLEALACIKDNYLFASELYHAFSDTEGKNVGLNFFDNQSGKLSLNLGTAKEKEKELIFELDIRYPVTKTEEEITEILQHKLSAKVHCFNNQKPLYVDRNHPLITSLLNAYNLVTGENAQPICIGGGTYARVLPLGVAFGPVFPNGNGGIHCADEYIDLDDFDKCIEIYYQALKILCF